MVAVSGESPLDLMPLLTTLESKSASLEHRLDAYNKLTKHLIEGELSIFEHDILQQGCRLLQVAKQDVGHCGELPDTLVLKALHVVGYCLNDQEIVRYVPVMELSSLVRLLCDVAVSCADKTVCTRSLWCLSKQNIVVDIVEGELPYILTSLTKTVNKWKGQSATVDNGVLTVITRLCEQCGKQMEAECAKWGRFVLSQLTSQALEVRKRAFDCLKQHVTFLSSHADFAHVAAADVKMIGQGLKKLFTEGQEAYTVRVWELLMQLFRQELSHTNVLNKMLHIIQPAFQSSSQEVRRLAFHSWKVFIDFVTENPQCWGDYRHVKLVMQVFITCNATSEETAVEKVGAMWHYVCRLGARAWSNFDLVITPLLYMCTGNIPLRVASAHATTATSTSTNSAAKPGAMQSPLSPRIASGSTLNISSTTCVKQQSIPKLQELGMKILAQLLGDNARPMPSSTLETFQPEAGLMPASFVKNATALIMTMFELIRCLTTRIPEPLLLYVWQSMVAQLTSALESPYRSDCREPLSTFLLQFQSLVLSQIIPQKLLLKLFKHVCSLPQKVLSSTAFNVCSGEVVKGCPAQFLCEVLLTPELLRDCTHDESFMILLSKIVQCGTSLPSRVLQFCQFVSELLDRNASYLPEPEGMWRLWSIIAHTVQEHITKTNEVNQGDSLEYNFDCLYATLLIPITHQLGTRVNQSVLKTLMKTWSELYHTFARLSALVTNAEENTVVEYLSHRILDNYISKKLNNAADLDYLMSICHVIVDTVDFSSLAPKQTFGLGLSPSPSRWNRRRHRPMGNIHSFVCLVAGLMEAVCTSARDHSEELPFTKQMKTGEDNAHLSSAANTSLEVMTTLVTHVNVSGIIRHLVETVALPLAHYMSVANKKTSLKLHSPTFLQKLEKLWGDVCGMIQNRYSGPYDSDLLIILSPLLQVAFLHSRRQIKNQTVLLWNSTFARSASLTYPPELQPVLTKVKEKTPILLPGWINVDVTVIDETPISQISQMDSQAPEPVLPGMPSPVRLRGSLLQKDLSPKPAYSSPAKKIIPSNLAGSLFGGRARKNLAVDLMPDEEFVVISTQPKKRRVLTDHQKEMMKEKRVFPVMYNNLDTSQDVSLISQLSSTDTQQELVSVPTNGENAVTVIGSSQSQDQELQDVQDAGMTLLENHGPVTTGKYEHLPARRRSLRRKTVHFEDASQENKSPVEPKLGSADQHHENIEHKKSLSEEEALDKSVYEGSLPKSDEDTKVASLPVPQPNQLAMFDEKLIESLSSKEASLRSKSSLSESSEERIVQEEADPFFRPFKSLSQSPRVTRSRYSQKLEEDISAKHSARRAYSQEIEESPKALVKGPKIKPASLPACTSLDKWLKKAASARPEPNTLWPAWLSEHSSQGDKGTGDIECSATTPQVLPQVFVEETQSPEDQTCKPSTTDLSIQETPPRAGTLLSMSSGVSVLSSKKAVNPPDEISNSSFSGKSGEQDKSVAAMTVSKQPAIHQKGLTDGVIQQEQNPASVLFSAAVVSTSRNIIVGNVPSSLESRGLFSDKAASQGFLPDSNSDQIPERLTRNTKFDVETSDKQEKAIHNQKTLFGFSELLEEEMTMEDEDIIGAVVSEVCPEEPGNKSVGLRNLTEGAEYDPGLTATLKSSQPSENELSRSQTSSVSTVTSGSQNLSSQSSFFSEPECRNFDPAVESTLVEEKGHVVVNKRKRSTPKKVDAAQNVRRNPRRKSERKSICSCCRDGQGQHHRTPDKEGRRRRHRSATKKVSNSELTASANDGKEECSDEQSFSKDKTDEEMCIESTDAVNEVTKAEITTEREVDAKEKLSPQEIGEKTPDLKAAAANRTPQRKSTTKKKMEEARRRSVSKSQRGSPGSAANSDSDSEDLPLSQLVLSSKSPSCLSARLNDVGAGNHAAKTSVTDLNKDHQKVRTRKGRCKLKLMGLTKSKLQKKLGTPTKLCLRQRKSVESACRDNSSFSQLAGTTANLEENVFSKESRKENAESEMSYLMEDKNPEEIIACSASPKENSSPTQSVIQKHKRFSGKVRQKLGKEPYRRCSFSPVSVRLRSFSRPRSTRSARGRLSSSFVLHSPKRLFRNQRKAKLQPESSSEIIDEKKEQKESSVGDQKLECPLQERCEKTKFHYQKEPSSVDVEPRISSENGCEKIRVDGQKEPEAADLEFQFSFEDKDGKMQQDDQKEPSVADMEPECPLQGRCEKMQQDDQKEPSVADINLEIFWGNRCEKMELGDHKKSSVADVERQIALELQEVNPDEAECSATDSVLLSSVTGPCRNSEINVKQTEIENMPNKCFINFLDKQRDDTEKTGDVNADDEKGESENCVDEGRAEEGAILQPDICKDAETSDNLKEKPLDNHLRETNLSSTDSGGFLHQCITGDEELFPHSMNPADNETAIKTVADVSKEEHNFIPGIAEQVFNQGADITTSNFPAQEQAESREVLRKTSATWNTAGNSTDTEKDNVAALGLFSISLAANDSSAPDSDKSSKEEISSKNVHNSEDIFASIHQDADCEMLACGDKHHFDNSGNVKMMDLPAVKSIGQRQLLEVFKESVQGSVPFSEDLAFSLNKTDAVVLPETNQQFLDVSQKGTSTAFGEQAVSIEDISDHSSRMEDDGRSHQGSDLTVASGEKQHIDKELRPEFQSMNINEISKDCPSFQGCNPAVAHGEEETDKELCMQFQSGNTNEISENCPSFLSTDPVTTSGEEQDIGKQLHTESQSGKTSEISENCTSFLSIGPTATSEEKQHIDKELCAELQSTNTNENLKNCPLFQDIGSSLSVETESVPQNNVTEAQSISADVQIQASLGAENNMNDSPLQFGMLCQSVSSDSKVVRSRAAYLRGKTLARRSILQQEMGSQWTSPVKSTDGTQQNENLKGLSSHRADVETVSPSGSPSGILKRRCQEDISQDGGLQCGSQPPTKKRRVSFANPVVSGESPSHQATLTHMVWRWDPTLSAARSAANFASYLSLQPAYSSKERIQQKLTRLRRKRCSSSENSQASTKSSQNSYTSTQESQLNSKNPIFPALVDCSKPAEIILPQLTSSVWHRGLNQLMKSRGVHTIGDLAKLTEVDIQLMPVRTPKVDVVRGALQRYYDLNHAKRPSPASVEGNSNDQETLQTKPAVHADGWEKLPGPDGGELPSADDALKELFLDKADDDDLNSSIEGPDYMEEQEWAGTDCPQRLSEQPTLVPLSPAEPTDVACHLKRTSSIKDLGSVIDSCSSEDISCLTNSQLFDLHKQLSTLTSIVFDTIRSRCTSLDSKDA